MYVIYTNDIIIAKILNNYYSNCIKLPDEFIDYDLDRLRFDGNNVIDVSDYTIFYIDENGEKHIKQNQNNTWQELECKWDDELQYDENTNSWKVVTLDNKKLEKMKEVYQLRKEKENNGIYVDDFYIDTSETGRLNLSNTINAYEWGLIDKSKELPWKIKSGEFKPVTYNKLKIFAGYVSYYIEALFEAEKYHDDNIKALTSINEIENYDYTSEYWISNQFYTENT